MRISVVNDAALAGQLRRFFQQFIDISAEQRAMLATTVAVTEQRRAVAGAALDTHIELRCGGMNGLYASAPEALEVLDEFSESGHPAGGTVSEREAIILAATALVCGELGGNVPNKIVETLVSPLLAAVEVEG